MCSFYFARARAPESFSVGRLRTYLYPATQRPPSLSHLPTNPPTSLPTNAGVDHAVELGRFDVHDKAAVAHPLHDVVHRVDVHHQNHRRRRRLRQKVLCGRACADVCVGGHTRAYVSVQIYDYNAAVMGAKNA